MTASFPAVDRAELAEFITTLYRHADVGTHIALRAWRDDADGPWNPKTWSTPRLRPNGVGNDLAPIIEAAADLARQCASAPERVVFACPIATFVRDNGTAEKDIANGIALSVECDQRPDEARERLEDLLGPATVIVASGGVWMDPATGEVQDRLHLHWRLATPTRDMRGHVQLKEARRFAQLLTGADGSAVPLCHPLRWPGSWHRKADPPRLAHIVAINPDTEIDIELALERLRDAQEADRIAKKEASKEVPLSSEPRPNGHGGKPDADALDVAAALNRLPNEDETYQVWRDVGLATWRATAGSEDGFAAFEAWSQKSQKFNVKCDTRQTWEHFAKSPPDRIGAATLFWRVRKIDPTWTKPSDRRLKEPPQDFDDRAPPPGAPETTKEIPKSQTIRVVAGERHIATDKGLAAMHAAGVAFYQRDRQLVRVSLIKAKTSNGDVIFVPGITPVSKPIIARALGQSANWERVNGKGEVVHIDPPRELADQIIDMVGEWPFPPLSGVIACPTLRPDGSLLDKEGYDDATGLVLHKSMALPPIPKRPTRDDAERAIANLKELLEGFPFVDDESLSVAFSQLMTPVLRGAFPVAPMHLTNAPQPGTGKSYLADVASTIATGERAAVISIGPDPEETEKRLIAAALSGHPIISLDNCRDVLQGDFLCQVTERPILQLRRLGSSDQIRVNNIFCVFANGNNVAVADDVVRRTITSTLDANMENPEERTFTSNPLALARRNRGLYVAAILTIGRAYITAGKHSRLVPLPSYEQWSDVVRSSIVWLGYPDPVKTMKAARLADPVRQTRASVFGAWAQDLVFNQGYLTSEIIKAASEKQHGDLVRPTFHDALLSVAEQKLSPGSIDALRLGHWLKKNENAVVGIHKLTVDRGDAKRPFWRMSLAKGH